MDLDDLLKKAIGLLMAKKKLANLVHVEKESQGVEDLIIKCDYKSCISFNSSFFVTPPSISAYHPPNFLFPPFVQTNDKHYRLVDKKIDHLTEMMKDLALSV